MTEGTRAKYFYGGIGAALLLFAAVQVWSFSRDFSNPPVVAEPAWVGAETRPLAQRACFDCHSNETEWPWYAKIYPASEMIIADVEKGREALNFSEWRGPYPKSDIDRMAEVVGKGQMPLPYYAILHPEAELTTEESGILTNGLIATMEGEGVEE